MAWDPETGEFDPMVTVIDPRNLPADYRLGAFGWNQPPSPSDDGSMVALIIDDPIKESSGSVPRSKGYGNNSVEIRQSSAGRVLHTLVGHVAGVSCATFSPDGRRLATASDDFTIKLWETATGREVFTLRGHTASVDSLAFSPDGNRIASGGLDHTARIWDATPLPAEVLKAADDRYQQKLKELQDLASGGDDGQRAEIHARNGRWGEAVTSYSRAIALHPTESMHLFKRGLAYGKLGRKAQADADYSKALALGANGSMTFLGHS